MKNIFLRVFTLWLIFGLAGCTFIFQKGRRSDVEKIKDLSEQLDDLTRTKRLLEQRLNQEISDKKVRLEMADRGLIITFVADVLFDSGKAQLKPDSLSMLDKVARVLLENVPKNYVGIEGHTDNQPIKYSGWKSNWELSTARALSVLHYLIEEKNIPPQRVSAIGYGEYRAVASNETGAGRQLNRRVEIVIMPPVAKTKTTKESGALKEPEENLK
jgi:chemotaxis protein MotB